MKIQHKGYSGYFGYSGYSGTVYTSKEGSVSIDLKLPDGQRDVIHLKPESKVFRDHPHLNDEELFKYVVDHLEQ